MKFAGHIGTIILCGVFGLLAAGCITDDAPVRAQTQDRPNFDIIRVGDRVKVEFSGTSAPPPPLEDEVKHDGTISLALIGAIKAEGKTHKELQDEIRSTYVPRYYQNLNVVVNPLNRYYSVGGEVRNPKREFYSGQMTVLQAIQSAGDFTDFADRSDVTLTRANGQILKIDGNKARKDPKYDLEVFPGDRIHVERRFW